MVKFNPLVKTDRIDRQIAILLFALALAGYLRGVAPDILPGDPGEFHFAAWRFGLAHPTGYPLYLIAGGIWQHLWSLIGINPARALNAFSALLGAIAVTFLFLLMRRWLTGASALSRLAALWVAVMFAVNPTFWSQNLIAEVYALHALFVVLILFAAQKLAKFPDAPISQSPNLPPAPTLSPRHLVILSALVGLSLTHHAMTLFLIPGLVIYVTLLDPRWWRSFRVWLASGIAFLAPLLLYLYIPLRSGPAASPWYHQRLGDGVLTLYDGTWTAFVDFVSGRSISVGFHDLSGAMAELPRAATLWRLHFGWPGLLLVILGLGALIWRRNWPVLALTLPYVLLQQTFNLFYAIDDILVYYIPLYLMATIWAGFGVHMLAWSDWLQGETSEGEAEIGEALETTGVTGVEDEEAAERRTEEETGRSIAYAMGVILLMAFFWLPWRALQTYAPRLDRSGYTAARDQWEAILAAQPPADAIMVSNDRNEIVPLFYLQAVEERATGMTGLFPLIAPDERFADIGATVETALEDGGDQPVLLIKEMPGLEARFDLQATEPPLVEVLGPAAATDPEITLLKPFGPLTLLGYDWTQGGDMVQVNLYWQVNQPLDADYTTTVQLYDEAGEKLGQDDRSPGGVYYPTSLWKSGETLLDRHTATIPAGAEPTCLLVGMYTGEEFTPLAEPLNIPFAVLRRKPDAKCAKDP